MNAGWLMIGSRMILPNLLVTRIIKKGNPQNHPGFNGMMLRDFVATAHCQ